MTEGERGRAISLHMLGHVDKRKSYTSSFDIKYSSSIHRTVICLSGEVEYKRDCVGELGILVVILREYGGRTILVEAVGHRLRVENVTTEKSGQATAYAFKSSPNLVKFHV